MNDPTPNTNTQVTRGLDDINQAFKEREVQNRAKTLGLPYVNLINVPINPDFAQVIPKEEAEEAAVALFFKSGRKLRLAALNPDDPKTQSLLSKLKEQKYEVALSLCSEASLKSAYRIYFLSSYQPKKAQENIVEEKDLGSFEKEIGDLVQLKEKVEKATFDEGLNYIQVGAYKAHATDIHFQPEEKQILVRLRVDGVLRPVFTLSLGAYAGILKEIKYLSHLKLNVTSIPQEGQYRFMMNQRQINVRVSILPSHFGEACVMRLLDPKQTFVSFEELGYEGEALRHLNEAGQLPHGIILITGPTGSGKTTTMYSILKSVDLAAKKVITLEDPVEYNLDGVTQSQVNPEAGYTFSSGLKAILRQDPDIIMVGEIRDLETAETAAQASLTGHLVISTLHTNSAVESIPRLLNMGVKTFILAPAIDLIVAQRLVRRLCSCKQEKPLTKMEREHIEFVLKSIQEKGLSAPSIPEKLFSPVGCTECAKTGYLHQIAVAEVLRFNQELRDLLVQNRPMPEIYDYIKKRLKMLSLLEDGVIKVLKGLTTLDEVYRVTI